MGYEYAESGLVRSYVVTRLATTVVSALIITAGFTRSEWMLCGLT